ncbi:DNA binding protein [Streptococcus phage 9A]|uniref:DNA binding protein n=2 Tax=Moineauvirus TaxID=1623304 RepID=A0A451EGH8_9CAUD|nr:DNA binding protein [Streptococcus phage SW7]YP_010648174.1 DNA binding protein [Streptococcus phage SWK3]ATI19588.1 DNA binding protein [Streptococcus phage 9A]AYP29287.1 DNA binding protein [Streptococcus phage SW21]AYP30112.1 DNA binding protein [Streptococcus phage SWK1]AYP30154.1 DNA binding protein [Streptococcus phage SWK2]AYP30236.1 DNA binding protein [Streptococcus phage SWK4]AYP30275.1 DNA binding protein [Streptococcus phage SWK5]
MQYKVITYFDNMEDSVEIYDSKDEAIKRLHHLRGVKYRNLKLYKVEMKEEAETDLITKINEWADERNLKQADPKIQWMRITEEVGEIRDVLLKPTKFTDPQMALKDAVGDTLVTIIVLAHQLDLDVTECLSIAYEEIKNRKGKMVNGTFVKEEDL